MNKDCKVSIERDANGSLKMQLTGHKDDIRMLWTMAQHQCCQIDQDPTSCAVRGLCRLGSSY